MNWRDIKTSDDRDMYAWQEENTGMIMAGIARNIWKSPEKEYRWLRYADENRRLRWPRDLNYTPIHEFQMHPLYKSTDQIPI